MFKKFTAFDQIPKEKQKDALELKDGSWILPEPTDTSTLERTLEKVRGERNEFEKEAKTERDKAADLQRKLDVATATGADASEKVTAMLTKWEADKTKAVADAVVEKDKTIKELSTKVERYELDEVLGATFVDKEVGGREERKARAIVLAKQDGFKLVNGKVVREVDGVVTTDSPKDYFSKVMRADIPEFFQGSQAGGGGAGGTNTNGGVPAGGGGNGTPEGPPNKWTSEQRKAYIEANGPEKLRELTNEHMRNALLNPPAREAAKA